MFFFSRSIANFGKVQKLESVENGSKPTTSAGTSKVGKKSTDKSKMKSTQKVTKEKSESPFDDNFEQDSALMDDVDRRFFQNDDEPFEGEEKELDEMLTQVEEAWTAELFLKKEQEMAERRLKFAEKVWKKQSKN